MLATLLNVPRWLVAAVVLCVLIGYAHQLECKFFGCKSPLSLAATGACDPAAPDNDDGATPCPGEHHCPGLCQFVALASCELPAPPHAPAWVSVSSYATWVERAPDAPCADIEHPPQLA